MFFYFLEFKSINGLWPRDKLKYACPGLKGFYHYVNLTDYESYNTFSDPLNRIPAGDSFKTVLHRIPAKITEETTHNRQIEFSTRRIIDEVITIRRLKPTFEDHETQDLGTLTRSEVEDLFKKIELNNSRLYELDGDKTVKTAVLKTDLTDDEIDEFLTGSD